MVRGARLGITCLAIASDYRSARGWAEDAESELAAQHHKLQAAAARAERERIAQPSSAAAAEEARRTREEAARFGEEIARRRVALRGREPATARRWRELHQRSADRLLRLCLTNGGIYVKLGQHVAQLDYLLPEPFTRTLAVLFTRTTPSAYEDVARLIEHDLGAPPEVVFESFERAPIASASLAQVHVAVARGSGRRLAVKVQHPGLREASDADLAFVAAAVRFASWAFPEDFTLSWVLDELAPHLPKELDFLHEASNQRRAAAFFARRPVGGHLLHSCGVARPRLTRDGERSRPFTYSRVVL
jgi:aarF domain-containing kinase